MPLIVSIAIAIAILLISLATTTKILSQPVVDLANGPIGMAVAFGLVVFIGFSIWNQLRKK